jgi:hypothetical protein
MLLILLTLLTLLILLILLTLLILLISPTRPIWRPAVLSAEYEVFDYARMVNFVVRKEI